ncbi:phosphoribosyltransferase [Nocardia puris]|uniref:Putative phosphoribosyltransferase n=1 Tax=Nocardia puris TaxID=208602 RepID=A0A366D9K5_9NOCA|nr:phosphoribosyltransferase family protein [Nocardia puris]MBF6214115.1 phosphoribosyltransferase [Nocardia puris]MBF6368601.1 phosphoribosyltransferase [Nocardia puris]MBF6461503.1 phosphoribosyltransferase [Nocardia puris]RBO86625.1 putative phosphoribosyltransferase [Nocardia puris]
MLFLDRRAAGRRLAQRLPEFRGGDTVVLGVPRGGIPVAYEVAAALGAPLDVAVVRRLRVPHRPDLAFGAVGEDGVAVVDDRVLMRAYVSDTGRAQVESEQREEVSRTAIRYRGGAPRHTLSGRTAVIVDDGVHSGSSARAAAAIAKFAGARRVVLAVPVGPAATLAALSRHVDHIVHLARTTTTEPIAHHYGDFTAVDDAHICDLLDAAASDLRHRAV